MANAKAHKIKRPKSLKTGPKKSKRKAVSSTVFDIFDSANRKRAVPIPDMKRGFNTIIQDLYDSKYNVTREYKIIEEALSIKDGLSPGSIQRAANNTEEMARRAFRLYIVGKFEYEAYIRETDSILGALRESVTEKLEIEKANKTRTKQITEQDIKEYSAQMYPDEWNEINNRRERAKGMLGYLENLSALARSRCYTVSNMLNPSGKL